MAEKDNSQRERKPEEAPEDRPEEPGAEGGSKSPASDRIPGLPAKGDKSPVGDTDQHSKA